MTSLLSRPCHGSLRLLIKAELPGAYVSSRIRPGRLSAPPPAPPPVLTPSTLACESQHRGPPVLRPCMTVPAPHRARTRPPLPPARPARFPLPEHPPAFSPSQETDACSRLLRTSALAAVRGAELARAVAGRIFVLSQMLPGLRVDAP